VADAPAASRAIGTGVGLLAMLALVALTLSLLPNHLSPGAFLPHVVVHLVGFGGLVVVATWVWQRPVFAGGAVFALSVAIEVLQTLVPWRQGTLRDVAVNAVAVAAGVVVGWWILRAADRSARSGKKPGST
jgi:VanZ family protein